jgi:tetratricopeptide (TPR) repeat protein
VTLPRRGGALVGLVLLVVGCAPASGRPSDPLSAEEHNDLGVAYYARGQYTLAAREFGRAIAQRPGWARALANLGDARLALGERDTAIAAYERALGAAPDDPRVANNLAWALLQDPARWREAEPVIRRALALGPEPAGYYLDTLGVLLLKKDEARGALAAFRAALADAELRDHATRIMVLRHTGEALVRLGERDAAERCERLARILTAPNPTDEIGGGEPVC